MKFTCSVDINFPIKYVVELFDNDENLVEWQDGFIRKVSISGIPGKPKAKARLFYSQKNKQLELIETIITNELPNEMIARYEHKHMINLKTDRFMSIGETKTRWESEIEYIQFMGLMPRLMAFLFPLHFDYCSTVITFYRRLSK